MSAPAPKRLLDLPDGSLHRALRPFPRQRVMPAPMAIESIVSTVLRIPSTNVTDQLSMRDCGNWDSLSHMELIATIEDEYGIELTTDEIVAMVSVAEIKATLGRRSLGQ